MPETRIPLTILTGFLGAGKTTLLDRVLSNKSTGRVAVIVNEFGEAGLDQDLIQAVEDDVVLMSSGCLCCSVRGELPKAILGLLEKREAGRFGFERIVIETTGLADPGPIFQTIAADPSLSRTVRLDGIATVVDAAHGAATLDAQFEAVSQVSMADLLILSKTDLVPPAASAELEIRLKSLNPTATIVPVVKGDIDPAALWNLAGTREDAPLSDAIAWTTARSEEPKLEPLANLSGLGATKDPNSAFTAHSPHDSRIGTASIIVEEEITDAGFEYWLTTLTALKGRDLLRVKGIIFLEGIELPFVVHGVQNIFERPLPLRTWTDTNRHSRIVVIARDMTRPELQRSLHMLRTHPRGPRHTAPATT
ncbi:MAG: GTP-binding protein [Pseudomonadota bacterium]